MDPLETLQGPQGVPDPQLFRGSPNHSLGTSSGPPETLHNSTDHDTNMMFDLDTDNDTDRYYIMMCYYIMSLLS